MLSSSVLYFERDYDAPDQPLLPPKRWPVDAMASISTHDLPTAAGFLRAENVRVRAELGLLDDRRRPSTSGRAEREGRAAGALDHGLLPPDPTEEDLVVALHAAARHGREPPAADLTAGRAGRARQPNLPGTVDEYPNWRIPLPVRVDELLADPRVRRAVAALRDARPVGITLSTDPLAVAREPTVLR